MFKRKQKFAECTSVPQMNTGAPAPALRVTDDALLVAYRTQSDSVAIVRFNRVHQHTFGYPNDEALGGHPLYSSELNFYAFNEVVDSPYLKELDRRNAVNFPNRSAGFSEMKHWFVPFHDETLEVVGGDIELVANVSAATPSAAIDAYES